MKHARLLLMYVTMFLQAHPWFKGVKWDMLYEMEAAYKPIVTGELDTQNFEKFPEVSTFISNKILIICRENIEKGDSKLWNQFEKCEISCSKSISLKFK